MFPPQEGDLGVDIVHCNIFLAMQHGLIYKEVIEFTAA